MEGMQGLYLIHHGIKGQKWGVRRFRNSDGSLTEEGKRRYNTTNPMTKGQAVRKIIVKNKLGLNKGAVSSVDREFRKALSSDEQATELKTQKNNASRAASDMYELATYREKDYQAIRDKNTRDGNTPSMYDKYRERMADSSSNEAWRRYDKLHVEELRARNAYVQRKNQIGHRYVDQYKRAVVKDMGLKDIDAGIKMLEEYGLFEFALGERAAYLKAD